MKIARCTDSQEHWYVTTRKPTICPNCGEKSVRKSIFGYPTPELFTVINIFKAECQIFQA